MLSALGGSEGSNPVYNSSVFKVRLCDRISIFMCLLKKRKKKKWKYTKGPHLRKWQSEADFGLFSELLQDNFNNLLLM